MPRLILAAFGVAFAAAAAPLRAQDAPPADPPPVDSIVVEGNARVPSSQIINAGGIVIGQRATYRDTQRALGTLYRTAQFDDVLIEMRQADGRQILAYRVSERPLLASWTVRGVKKLREGQVREKVRLTDGRPLDRVAVQRSRFAIDSLYRDNGYYAAKVDVVTEVQPDGRVSVLYAIAEGERVAISQVVVNGNEVFKDKAVVAKMASQPEGFWWWQSGEYDEEKVEEDIRERLPSWYASKGYVDFQVIEDSLVPDPEKGKAQLFLTVEEGKMYRVGTFDVAGNRAFSTDEILTLYPFGIVTPGGAPADTVPFDRERWDAASERLRNLYANNGYIYAQVHPEEIRRTLPDGTPVLDLRWQVREGQVATINRIDITGNDVTHERVIREAVVLFPGQVFNRDLLVRSWQNIQNLGFFQQPMAPPDVQPSENGADVNIVFRVEERRTGNINFGASLGQGTGIGGFLGLEEPNLFGRGKRGRLQWQFGANINDFQLSYTDPNIRESRISGTISLFDSRARYVVGDLGRRRQTGFNLQAGFPLLGARYTRLYVSYGLQQIQYTGGSEDLRERFQCSQCTRSTVGATVVRDTRVGLPFATAGTYVNLGGELNGGVLGGTGDYRKVDVEGRFYAPLGTLGGSGQLGSGVAMVLGLTARSGWIFGDAGPFYTEYFSMGGVQFGIPLRGYDEFSITPDGYDAQATNNRASTNAFGQSFAAFGIELGARVSQFLYVSTFFDAGSIYRNARQYDPTRLFRGAGFGAAVISPLGPLGVDIAYGFDKVNSVGRPAPGWQLHFRLGNFF